MNFKDELLLLFFFLFLSHTRLLWVLKEISGGIRPIGKLKLEMVRFLTDRNVEKPDFLEFVGEWMSYANKSIWRQYPHST